MLLQPTITELLLSADLRHFKIDAFQTMFYDGSKKIYITAKCIQVDKWDEGKNCFGPVMNMDVNVASLTVEKWKLILALVGIDPGPIVIESFESKLKQAI